MRTRGRDEPERRAEELAHAKARIAARKCIACSAWRDAKDLAECCRFSTRESASLAPQRAPRIAQRHDAHQDAREQPLHRATHKAARTAPHIAPPHAEREGARCTLVGGTIASHGHSTPLRAAGSDGPGG